VTALMRLADDELELFAPAEVDWFSYPHERKQAVGIVHFGIGAFHRAHQAWYTDLAMSDGERDWMISGVSLRSATVANQLNPQDGLYTLTERDGAKSSTRLIGSVREVLVAPHDRFPIVARVAAQDCHIVSFTVTEKGYCRASDGSLDLALTATSFYPLLAEGLARRRDFGLAGVTLLSCDNLAENGRTLERLVGEYLSARHHDLSEWFEANCTCPATMVDRIVPASTEADREAVGDLLGMRDEGAVFTEPFSQWVIEDRFAGPRPSWENYGAQLVRDVAPYETAKLRMLNGTHSALAYLGLERGHTYVHEAVADPELRPLVQRLMRIEAADSFTAAPEQNLAAYADALLARFGNSALQHRLIQIAMDGSEKIPQRWLETVAAQRAKGAECPSILAGLAAWLRHVRGDARPVDDPRAELLADLWRSEGEAGIAAAVLGPGGLLGPALGEGDLRRLPGLL
jgi:fructuronate reductase